MPQPPDEPLGELLGQLEEILAQADLGPDVPRDALLEGVRDVIRALGLDTEPRTRRGIEVVVVEGGRGQDEPPAPGAPPHLRLASASDDEPEPLSTTVRVIHGGEDPDPPGVVDLGQILLLPGGTQTLYVGDQSHPYRVCCDSGVLSVLVGGQVVGHLLAGQTMDATTRVLAVSADMHAEGCYVRL